jgi:hypothetical protein
VEHLESASLRYAPAQPTNIRLGWKGLPGTNTLAYYENPNIRAVKSFIELTPVYIITLITAVINSVSIFVIISHFLLAQTNALAYYGTVLITAVFGHMIQG